ncbi:MAG: V-type ATP synthase subunit F [Clostridia bacterium]|nr:V-type ATP synthase subunit F [Clostridia bacterium]
MIKKGKIAVIGDKDSVLAFKAVGMDTFSATNVFETNDLLKRLKDDYAVIFITETLAEQAADTLEKLKSRPYPAVIPIPGAGGSNGYGKQSIKRDVEKAIGADILFGE